MSKQKLEQELKNDWNKWQSKAHPEDRMSFIEYAEDLGTYKGYKIEVDFSGNIYFFL
tara:strand:- start:280 stop:450 length:171 start_codon:yes stop_codon:yes gene_type:complete